MYKPSWEQQEDNENQELEREIARQGELESRRNSDHFYEGDVFGLNDGRPGLSLERNPLSGGYYGIPPLWRLVIRIILPLAAFATAWLVRHYLMQ